MTARLYKLVFDISILYSIIVFLLRSFGDITIHSRTFLILLAAVGISLLLNRKRIVKLPVVIVLTIVSLPFLLPSIPDVAAFLLIWGYSSYVLVSERVVTSHGEFMDMLKHTLALILLLIAIVLAVVIQKIAVALQVACPYFIMAMVSAVALLRDLRFHNQTESEQEYHHRQQLIELIAFLIISALLTIIKAPQNLFHGLRLIYLSLLEPIIAFLAGVIGIIISGIIYLLIAIFKLVTNNREIRQVQIDLGSPIEQAANAYNTTSSNPNWVMPLLYSVGILLGIIVLILFFRKIMGGRLNRILPTGVSEIREHLTDEGDKTATFRRRRPKDPRAAVRYYYWKSLLWLRHKNAELKPQATTEDINHVWNDLLGEKDVVKSDAPKLFMKLYRRARYQMSESISYEDAEKAKQLYREITK